MSGQELKKLRLDTNLTLQQVADALVARGHSYRSGRKFVGGWENGDARAPAVVVPDLAGIYGVSSDVVLQAIREDQADG